MVVCIPLKLAPARPTPTSNGHYDDGPLKKNRTTTDAIQLRQQHSKLPPTNYNTNRGPPALSNLHLLKMFGFTGLRRPLFTYASSVVAQISRVGYTGYNNNTTFVRTLMKSHKGAAKRWRKTANGFKRGQAARNHGNAGWSSSTLRGDGSKGMSTKDQTKRLKKLLPYH